MLSRRRFTLQLLVERTYGDPPPQNQDGRGRGSGRRRGFFFFFKESLIAFILSRIWGSRGRGRGGGRVEVVRAEGL